MEPFSAILGSSLLGSAAEGGLGFLGNMMQGKQAQQNAQNQFFYNLLLQGQQQMYNTQMANTQYQRTVADMKAAGVNPMALAGGASLSASPTSSAGSVSQAEAVNPLEGVASSAHQGAKIGTEIVQALKHIDKTSAETKKILAEKEKTSAETPTHNQFSRRYEMDIGEGASRINKNVQDTNTGRENEAMTKQTREREGNVGKGDLWNAGTYEPAVKAIIKEVLKHVPNDSGHSAQSRSPYGGLSRRGFHSSAAAGPAQKQLRDAWKRSH